MVSLLLIIELPARNVSVAEAGTLRLCVEIYINIYIV